MDNYNIAVEGEKKTYGGGATRCDKSGKGRFDLIIEKVYLEILDYLDTPEFANTYQRDNTIYVPDQQDIHKYAWGHEYKKAIIAMALNRYIYDHLISKTTTDKECSTKLTVIKCMALLLKELAVHFEKGAIIYGERNCQKGIPLWSFRDSGLRHLGQTTLEENDGENHFISAVWNFWLAEWTTHHENDSIVPKPEYHPEDKRVEMFLFKLPAADRHDTIFVSSPHYHFEFDLDNLPKNISIMTDPEASGFEEMAQWCESPPVRISFRANIIGRHNNFEGDLRLFKDGLLAINNIVHITADAENEKLVIKYYENFSEKSKSRAIGETLEQIWKNGIANRQKTKDIVDDEPKNTVEEWDMEISIIKYPCSKPEDIITLKRKSNGFIIYSKSLDKCRDLDLDKDGIGLIKIGFYDDGKEYADMIRCFEENTPHYIGFIVSFTDKPEVSYTATGTLKIYGERDGLFEIQNINDLRDTNSSALHSWG